MKNITKNKSIGTAIDVSLVPDTSNKWVRQALDVILLKQTENRETQLPIQGFASSPVDPFAEK